MKPVAIILLVICLACVAGTAYLYLDANLTVTDIRCTAYAAEDQAATFQELKKQLLSETFVGVPFDTEDLGEAEDYQFYDYTVTLRNATFLKAEIIEIQITPMKGDVLQLSDLSPHDLAPRSQGSLSATILTPKSMHNVREMTLTYYLGGLPFSERLTYSD